MLFHVAAKLRLVLLFSLAGIYLPLEISVRIKYLLSHLMNLHLEISMCAYVDSIQRFILIFSAWFLHRSLQIVIDFCAAILAYKTLSGTKNFKKFVHLTLQLVALILGLIGTWAAYKFHNERGIDNFYSLHSWLGLLCLFLFAIQVCNFFFISCKLL